MRNEGQGRVGQGWQGRWEAELLGALGRCWRAYFFFPKAMKDGDMLRDLEHGQVYLF